MMFRFRIVFILLFASCIGKVLPAQEFSVKAALDAVPSTGFYRIPVLPGLTAFSKVDFSDLRIQNQNRQQIPFIIRSSIPVISGDSFIDFPILKQATDSIRTIVEMASPIKDGSNHISLIMGNHAVERYISISGSNDRQQWYIIDDNIPLGNTAQDASGSFIQSVYFPFSRYSYYKLTINNAHTDPLHIIKAGVYIQERQTGGPSFISNPPVRFIQSDSNNGHSYLDIRQKESYHTDKVVLRIKGPKYYKRVAKLYYWDQRGKRVYPIQFEVSSGYPPIIPVDRLKANRLMIEIQNQDNPPLEVLAVTTEQNSKDVVAYLEKGNSYFIVAGNESLKAPEYDLFQFRDSIPTQINSLLYHHLQISGAAVPVENKIVMSYWLWPAIILFLFILGFLTYQLLADMKRSGI